MKFLEKLKTSLLKTAAQYIPFYLKAYGLLLRYMQIQHFLAGKKLLVGMMALMEQVMMEKNTSMKFLVEEMEMDEILKLMNLFDFEHFGIRLRILMVR